MKKIFKSFVAIMCAVIMFAAPTATASAESNLVVYEDNNIKLFRYQPDPLALSQNQNINLLNNTNGGYFRVPAGNDFIVNVYLADSEYHYYRIAIYKKYGDVSYYTPIINEKYPHITIPATSTDEDYVISFTAYSHDVKLSGYDGVIQQPE